MKIKNKIFIITFCPLLLIGIVVMLITFTVVKGALLNEIKDSLKGAATATYAAYNQNSGEYIKAENGDVWKGGYNISKSENIVDTIKEKSGVEVTFFYGSERIMTSAKDKNGDRILKSPAGDKIKKTVLEEGKEYFSKSVSIEGVIHYGYYIPVYQEGQKNPVGMIFVGANKAQKDASVNGIIWPIATVVGVVMIVGIIAAVILSLSITHPLNKGIDAVHAVAQGNLEADVDRKHMNGKDEIGDLTRSIIDLQKEMKQSIENISHNSDSVMQASVELEKTAGKAAESMKDVEETINEITRRAELQADISLRTSDNIKNMGEKILDTSKEVELMENNAEDMSNSEKQNAATIQNLLRSNEKVHELINDISDQTKKTNISARKIREVTDMIASIAEETNLLSLNASIEAARAGESGKGFAVVATQIQNLAIQSNESSKRIEEIIEKLVQDSDEAVETMEKVTDRISEQNKNMEETRVASVDVMDKIKQSVDSMKVIEESVKYLDKSKEELIDTVNELLSMATDNVDTAKNTCETVENVTETFNHIEGSTISLRKVADELENSMQHFKC